MLTHWVRSCRFAVRFLVAIAVFSPLSATQSVKLDLELIYEYKPKPAPKGKMLAVMDPKSLLLYVVEEKHARVRVIDWRIAEEISSKEFSSLPCDRMNPEWWAKNDPTRRITKWELLPGTSWAHMIYCDSQYLVNIDTLKVERKLIDGTRESGGALFYPLADQVIISSSLPGEQRFHSRLLRTDTWEQLREWEEDTGDELVVFSSDGEYGGIISFPTDASGEVIACGVVIQEVATGRLISKWEVTLEQEESVGSCPKPFEFLPQDRDTLVEFFSAPRTVITLRSASTGKVIRTIQDKRSIATTPSISPNGRFVVAGAWNDPQDDPRSQDFKIWDIQTGEIVYETPVYRSVWGSRTMGREVYPRFSYDGRYLILVKERSIELYRVSAQGYATRKSE